jgi:hypothetical protein
MHMSFGLAMLATTVAIQIVSGDARAQTSGALQYPPPEVGEDAQPPPPARMVPQVVFPRRIELGISGSSQPPVGYGYRVRPPAEIDVVPKNPPFRADASSAPPPTTGN